MADVALQSGRTAATQTARKSSGLRNWLNRKSTIAFLIHCCRACAFNPDISKKLVRQKPILSGELE